MSALQLAPGSWFARGEVLVTGACGQLGGEFMRALSAAGVPHRGTSRAGSDGTLALNLLAPDELEDAITCTRPAVVINTAAYTAVDRAEQEVDVAMGVNARAPEALASACVRVGALLVHFSTDYVFDGRAGRAYTEQDPVTPLSCYGRSKAIGEQAVCASGAAHLVLRTSWLYSPGGRNFVATMLRLFKDQELVRVVDDQIGCPTWARMLVTALTRLLASTDAARIEAARGLYHLCSGGEASWYDFARAIHERAQSSPRARLERTDTASFGAPAARPAYSVLDCTKAHRELGLSLPHWREQLDAAMPEFTARALGGH